jgi:glycosyltransferase involved in cell wall biosynthesis
MSERISAIILTYNEAKHIERCLRSLEGVADQTVVIDSGSTDATVDLCRSFGAEVLVNPWRNYSTQFNWGLDSTTLTGEWCLRIDADEYLTDELRATLQAQVMQGMVTPEVTGLYVNRVMVFMGRALRWGGCGRLPMLRLFRRGVGRCEERWMDEHIALTRGSTLQLRGDLVDENLNNIGWWVTKHNGYATREAIDLLNISYGFDPQTERESIGLRTKAGRKRLLKEAVYSRLPTGIRAAAYFLYRYVVQLGVLDGRAGLVFHFMQGFWYRFLVDLKVNEIRRKAHARGLPLATVIRDEYGIQVGPKQRSAAPP